MRPQTIDKSIHSAYVTAIRRAQHFIYIENQYFLGSSHCWPANRNAPCRHLIPLEIALKIVSKINQGQRFAAYIVLPMYSEGLHASHATAGRLCWANRGLLSGQGLCAAHAPGLLCAHTKFAKLEGHPAGNTSARRALSWCEWELCAQGIPRPTRCRRFCASRRTPFA